jgi:uncharacterized protein (TIGR03083 family)
MAADYGRILEVVPGHLSDGVPTCPRWTVGDLTRHVATVYLHKVAVLRDGRAPEAWPPAGVDDEEPVGLLERAYGELVGELAARSPLEASETWYGPDQTVGFWVRRMAQETVVHRIDAELGAGAAVAAVADDLAIDGVDELLKVFVAFSMGEWPEDFVEEWPKDSSGAPGGPASRTYGIGTEGASWLVSAGAGRFEVEGGPGVSVDVGGADIVVRGAPGALLRWVWNRESADSGTALAVEGDVDALDDFRQFVVIATQLSRLGHRDSVKAGRRTRSGMDGVMDPSRRSRATSTSSRQVRAVLSSMRSLGWRWCGRTVLKPTASR